MKQQRLKFKLLALFLFSLIALLIAYGAYSVKNYGSRWFSSRWNERVVDQKGNVTAGDILDRNGVTLATVNDGKRVYPGDKLTRTALSLLIGDANGLVSNGVERFQAEYLYGFRTPVWELAATLFTGAERKGDTVILTIDSVLTSEIAAVWREKAPEQSGAVVVMRADTGEILASVSLPGFDLNAPPGPSNESDGLYRSRVTQHTEAPGPAFGIVTAAAALNSASEETTGILLNCTGNLVVDGLILPDTGHGEVTLVDAVGQGCAAGLARAAMGVGAAALRDTAAGFGFNENFLFRDLVVDNSAYPTEKRTETNRGLAAASYGSGSVAVTPLHLCMITSSIADKGVMMEPKLIRAVRGVSGSARADLKPAVYRTPVTVQTAQRIASMLALYRFGNTTVRGVICESGSNAWFTGFQTGETPVTVTILLENGDTKAVRSIASGIWQAVQRMQENAVQPTAVPTDSPAPVQSAQPEAQPSAMPDPAATMPAAG